MGRKGKTLNRDDSELATVRVNLVRGCLQNCIKLSCLQCDNKCCTDTHHSCPMAKPRPCPCGKVMTPSEACSCLKQGA